MRNPFLKKPIWIILYTLWWILPSSIHSFVLWKAFELPLSNVLIDASISFTILAVIGLSLWYMVRYTFNDSENWQKSLQTHLIAMGIIFALWIGSTYGIITLISNDYSSSFEPTILWRLLLFLPVYLLIISSYYLFSSLDKLNNQELQKSKMEAMVRSAELDTLKSQINPHFLFNSLNSASSLTLTNPNKAQEMIINISDFFRFTLMSSKNQFTNLAKELEHALLYIEIEKGRFGEKIQVNAELPQELEDVEVPSLILQPLIENAIKHGVYESSKEVAINFLFEHIGDKIKIRIENQIDEANGSAKKSTATGLNNVTKRLELAYGQKNLLMTEKTEDSFAVSIWIPLNQEISNKI